MTASDADLRTVLRFSDDGDLEKVSSWEELDGKHSVSMTELCSELLARREADRWTKNTNADVPAHEMLEAYNVDTRAREFCMFGSALWERISPTHYRISKPPEVTK
jgi:hypothetical protein